MRLVRYIKDYAKSFQRPTLSEIVEQQVKEQAATVSDCDIVILNHKFQKHMAEANIKALKQWADTYQRSLLS